jgi:hypothetical protein
MKILCNGCSFTYGAGFLEHERHEKTWPSILGNRLGATTVTNVAMKGSSNNEIFLRTLRAMDQTYYDIVIVQWSSLRRHWFEPGLDRNYICSGNPRDLVENWSHKDKYLSKSKRKIFSDILTMLTGDYRASMDLALFCKTLIKLRQNTKMVFVNGLVPWTKELIYPPEYPFDMSAVFSDFTRMMLEFDTLDDGEILSWFIKLRNEIMPTVPNWVNIDNSWLKNLVDKATEDHHPGPKSQIWMADQIHQFLVDQKRSR